MSYFRHVDDTIIIDDGIGSQLAMSLSFFLTQEPTYALPTTDVHGTAIVCIGQEYIPGSTHRLYTDGTQYLGEYPWATGDGYISKRDIYHDALYPPQTLDEAKNDKISNLLQYANDYYSGGVSISAVIYFSGLRYLHALKNDFEYFTSVGSLPGGYYAYDTSYNRVAVANLTALSVIIYKIEELHYETRLVFDDHRDAIVALTTIPQVESYNYTTGWPTVPFV